MRPPETISHLAAFKARGPGTDAERRAAGWLQRMLREAGREAHLETFWCRPNWALAHAWHVALALAGSLVSVSSPRIGGVLVLAALLSLVSDELLGFSPGRRLTREHASQNVVSTAPAPRARETEPRVRLIVTANYDAGRMGFVYTNGPRRAVAWLRNLAGGAAPGWSGWLAVAFVWLLVTAVLRLQGHRGTAVGVAQLLPTVALVLAFAMLVELAGSEFGPAAADNASGAAVALAIIRALDMAPPRNLQPELLLAGAGAGGGIGLRRYLRSRGRSLRASNVVVLGIAPSGAGAPRWWTSDGSFVPLRYFVRLRELCEGIADAQKVNRPAPHRGRGATPALMARASRLPAIAVGCLDEMGVVPRSHQPSDIAAAIDPAALDATLQFALMLVDAIDAYVGRLRGTRQGSG